MDKQELIDKAVEDLKGKLPQHAPDHRTVLILSTKHNHVWGAGKYEVCYRENLKVPYHNSWMMICSTDEFTTRALELSWINGYKWGVEYPTNGKKPDLPDDVVVEICQRRGWRDITFKAKEVDFELQECNSDVMAFRIVDKRYKSKEPEQQTKLDNSWHRGLPVEFPSGFGVIIVPEQDCNGVVIVMAEGGEYRRVAADVINPIKSEREKFIEAALDVVEKSGSDCDAKYITALYDAGFKAPDEKSGK